MLNKNENIEDLFGNTFRDSEITPPDNIWDKLEISLNKQSVEDLYKTTFENNSISPSPKIWKRISHTLFFHNFLRFNPLSFNIYYIALSTIVGVIGLNTFFPKSTTEKNQKYTIIAQKTDILKSSSGSRTIQNDKFVGTISSNIIPEKNYTSNINDQKNISIIQNNTVSHSFTNTTNNSNNQNNAFLSRTVDFSQTRIIGKKKICILTNAEYTIDGVPEGSEITWNFPQKQGLIKSLSTRKLLALWNKEGNFIVSAILKNGNSIKNIDFPIEVEALQSPVIKGKDRVCEGQEKQLYSVDEPVNQNITYIWDTKSNQIDVKGNKYINIDWTVSGKDTLFVTKVDNVTGCIARASMEIQINQKPAIDFEMTPLGNSEFEFHYLGNTKKLNSIKWKIEGDEYDDAVIVHESNGLSSSFVVLTVKDKNNCVSTVQREVAFNKHILFVPKQFSVNEDNAFIPQTNSVLTYYKIEIYNAQNEKIWESTKLANGKPAQTWDGTYKGASLPKGKYYWEISAQFDDGTQWKGTPQGNGECKPNGIVILEN